MPNPWKRSSVSQEDQTKYLASALQVPLSYRLFSMLNTLGTLEILECPQHLFTPQCFHAGFYDFGWIAGLQK